MCNICSDNPGNMYPVRLCVHRVHSRLRWSRSQRRFDVSVPEETGDKLKELVEECADPGATRSEIIAAVLSAYFQSSDDEIACTREFLK